jgi:hypothetical protein
VAQRQLCRQQQRAQVCDANGGYAVLALLLWLQVTLELLPACPMHQQQKPLLQQRLEQERAAAAAAAGGGGSLAPAARAGIAGCV